MNILKELEERVMAVFSRVLGWLWCKIMEKLENKYCASQAYAVAVVHCFFVGAMGFPAIKSTFTSLFKLPSLLRKKTWEEG